MKKGPYSRFVLFSPGSVGDHLVMVDFANHFFKATSIPSTILLKHPSSFLRDLSTPYKDHITNLNFGGIRGMMRIMLLSLESLYRKNCYVLLFPIPLPRYMRIFIFYIRFFTRSRIVGFNHEGTKFFPKGKGYASVLGKKNSIPLEAEMFYESANKMLRFLGFHAIERVPRLDYVFHENVFHKLNIKQGEYIALHIVPSHYFRSLPIDRWNYIIKELVKKLPDTKLVFTGIKKDVSYIESCLEGIPRDTVVIAAGKTENGAQELLTLYAHARVNVTVQTGNGLMINMLHVPAVVVNIKGTAMFYYDFNEKAKILYSKRNCVCNPFRTSCNFILHTDDKEYMACIYNINNDDVVSSVIEKYNEKQD